MQVFVCCDAEDCKKNFHDSEMNRLIDQYTNSILLNITIPPPPRKKTKVAEEGMGRAGEAGGRGGLVWEQGWQKMISLSACTLSYHFAHSSQEDRSMTEDRPLQRGKTHLTA